MIRKSSLVSAIALFFAAQSAIGQSLGFEVGTAAVENFKAGIPDIGLTVRLRVARRLFCDLSLFSWRGEDENYSRDFRNPHMSSDTFYFGDSGLNMTIYHRIFQRRKISLSFGAGLGRYQMIALNSQNDRRRFDQATFSLSAMLTFRVSGKFAIFARPMLNCRHLGDSPSWGLFNAGIELSPFHRRSDTTENPSHLDLNSDPIICPRGTRQIRAGKSFVLFPFSAYY